VFDEPRAQVLAAAHLLMCGDPLRLGGGWERHGALGHPPASRRPAPRVSVVTRFRAGEVVRQDAAGEVIVDRPRLRGSGSYETIAAPNLGKWDLHETLPSDWFGGIEPRGTRHATQQVPLFSGCRVFRLR